MGDEVRADTVEGLRRTKADGGMAEYVHPTSLEEALACLGRHDGGARVIAGATDALPDLRAGRIAPRCLVDITRIPALQRIDVDGQFVTVGAAVTFAAIRRHAFLREHVHALVDAAGSVGAAAIQNAATWVGNIVQAMPAADGAIVAVALGAEAEVADGNGARWEPVEALFEGPGRSTVDSRREIVTRVRFARPEARTGTAWRRVGRRAALVLPILNCAVWVELEGEPHAEPGVREGGATIAKVAVALGPVAPRPCRARRAEAYLRGRAASAGALGEASDIARSEADPRTSVMRASRAYRLEILPTLVNDALATAIQRARQRPDLGKETMKE